MSQGKIFPWFFVILYCLYYVKICPKRRFEIFDFNCSYSDYVEIIMSKSAQNDVLRLVKRGFETEFDVNND